MMHSVGVVYIFTEKLKQLNYKVKQLFYNNTFLRDSAHYAEVSTCKQKLCIIHDFLFFPPYKQKSSNSRDLVSKFIARYRAPAIKASCSRPALVSRRLHWPFMATTFSGNSIGKPYQVSRPYNLIHRLASPS